MQTYNITTKLDSKYSFVDRF